MRMYRAARLWNNCGEIMLGCRRIFVVQLACQKLVLRWVIHRDFPFDISEVCGFSTVYLLSSFFILFSFFFYHSTGYWCVVKLWTVNGFMCRVGRAVSETTPLWCVESRKLYFILSRVTCGIDGAHVVCMGTESPKRASSSVQGWTIRVEKS